MIEVAGLTHRYGPLTAIEDLSFSVARGEVLGLLGPNGAGKTTTLRAVVGLLAPTAGKVCIGECDMAREPLTARRLLGFLPESVPLYRELRVREFLRYVSLAKGVARENIASEMERVIEACGLAPVATRLIGFCSRGFRQRIGLAQALLADPPVLVLDEPTVGLDPAQVVEIRDTVAHLAKAKAVILSTHILPEASRLCSRVLIVDKGRAVADGAPDDLERMLAGGTQVRIVCGCDSAGQRSGIERTMAQAVASATFTADAAAAGQAGWIVDVAQAAAVPRLVDALVRAGYAVQEVSPLRRGLEGVFLALVRQEHAGSTLASAPREGAPAPVGGTGAEGE
jgi:ABC-2 type transport system ATP-binding protein